MKIWVISTIKYPDKLSIFSRKMSGILLEVRGNGDYNWAIIIKTREVVRLPRQTAAAL